MSDKVWNADAANWEIDGVPVTYRVSWTVMDSGGERRTEETTNVDQGYGFYEDMKRSANAYKVTWGHIPW